MTKMWTSNLQKDYKFKQSHLVEKDNLSGLLEDT